MIGVSELEKKAVRDLRESAEAFESGKINRLQFVWNEEQVLEALRGS